MEASGLAEVERARADGRWDKAYDGQRTARPPADFLEALDRTYLVFGTGRVADRGLCRCAGGGLGVLSGYLRVSGTGVPSSWKARAWTGVGVVSLSMRCPAKMMTWRVRVARWASRS